MSDSTESTEPRTFEKAIADVEQIVHQLESGRLDLSQSLNEYQRGVATLKECYDLLSQAERRITLLSGFDADGNPVSEPFEQAATTMESKQKSRATRRGYSKKQEKAVSPSELDSMDSDDSTTGLF